jgi:hypothetical protein
MIRSPAVAGLFYPDDAVQLRNTIEGCIEPAARKRTAVGAISPHAGYMYCGKVCGKVFSRIKIPESVIILGVNHADIGNDVSVASEGLWDMPCGGVRINSRLAQAILRTNSLFVADNEVHEMEHSVEAQIPFLRYFRSDLSFVPIIFKQLSYEKCRLLAKSLAMAIDSYKKDVLVVATTDMTHYESRETTTMKDRLAIDRISALDAKGLFETVRREQISMCGSVPCTIAIATCKALKATKAALVSYATSDQVSGNHDQVVGYAGFVIT